MSACQEQNNTPWTNLPNGFRHTPVFYLSHLCLNPRVWDHLFSPRIDQSNLPFRSPHISLCLSEETLKAGGPFYLVSMPGEIKYPTQGVNV